MYSLLFQSYVCDRFSTVIQLIPTKFELEKRRLRRQKPCLDGGGLHLPFVPVMSS